jgi:hypothetical protein
MENTALLGQIFFVILAVIVPLIVKRRVQSYLICSCVSAAIVTVAYQLIGVMINQYLDPLFLFALTIGFVVALVVALFTLAIARLFASDAESASK